MLVRILIFVLILAAAIAGGLYLLGRQEPASVLAAQSPSWFVAVKDGPAGPASAAPVQGVRIVWEAKADFPFIGAGERYWDRFLLLAGGEDAASPVALANEADAAIFRLAVETPPALVLGALRAAVRTGLLERPAGAVLHDAAGVSSRPDLMPRSQDIATLLAQPRSYRPAMVNFLDYHETAQDGSGESGRDAYLRYGAVALRTVYQTGGHLVFYGRVAGVVRTAQGGPSAGGDWDEIAAMTYSDPEGILTMEQVARYRAALVHRDAGLARTVVIAASP